MNSIWQLITISGNNMIAGHTKFYYLEVAGVSPQPAVGLALPRPGVVGVGDVPAPSVSTLPSLVPAKRK